MNSVSGFWYSDGYNSQVLVSPLHNNFNPLFLVNPPASSSRPSYPVVERLPPKPVDPNPFSSKLVEPNPFSSNLVEPNSTEELESNVLEEDNEDQLVSPIAEVAKPVQVFN